MKWLIIILIVAAVLIVAALVWKAMQSKRDQQARVRADELRSQAANTAGVHEEEAARAREAQAEAERARARADRLAAQAREQQTAYDQSRAQHEDHIREADRLDPDVDHRSKDYAPTADTRHPGSAQAAPTTDGRATDGPATDGRPTEARPTEARPVDGQPTDARTDDEHSNQGIDSETGETRRWSDDESPGRHQA